MVARKDRAEACLSFLDDPASDLRDLNGDKTLFTAQIAEPGTHEVKVIYRYGENPDRFPRRNER
jgi:hypothetical protein